MLELVFDQKVIIFRGAAACVSCAGIKLTGQVHAIMFGLVPLRITLILLQ